MELFLSKHTHAKKVIIHFDENMTDENMIHKSNTKHCLKKKITAAIQMLNFLSSATFPDFHVETATRWIGRKKSGLASCSFSCHWGCFLSWRNTERHILQRLIGVSWTMNYIINAALHHQCYRNINRKWIQLKRTHIYIYNTLCICILLYTVRIERKRHLLRAELKLIKFPTCTTLVVTVL